MSTNRDEGYEVTETAAGDRVSLHTMVIDSKFYYHVSKFTGNDYTSLYMGKNEVLASAIYNEYRAEHLFD